MYVSFTSLTRDCNNGCGEKVAIHAIRPPHTRMTQLGSGSGQQSAHWRAQGTNVPFQRRMRRLANNECAKPLVSYLCPTDC